jgi:hypothetical protein
MTGVGFQMQTTTKISLELLKSALRCNCFEDTRSSSQGIGRIGHQNNVYNHISIRSYI